MSGDTWQAMCHNAWQRHTCVTHGMPCVNMHGNLEGYKRGVPIQFGGGGGGGGASFSSWEQQGEGGGREERKGGKEKRKGGKERRKGGRKEKKKWEEERKKKEEKEGVLHSKQTRTTKNAELRCKR